MEISLYNHSKDFNTDYGINKRSKSITLKANRTIKKGEELCIDYEWGDEWTKGFVK